MLDAAPSVVADLVAIKPACCNGGLMCASRQGPN